MLVSRKCVHASLSPILLFVRSYAKYVPPGNLPRTNPDNLPLPVFPHPPKPKPNPYQILFDTYVDKEEINKRRESEQIRKYHPMWFNLADAIPSDAPPLLTREYIYDSLYNSSYGYFSSKEEIINPDSKINFKELKGVEQYYKTLKENYDTGPKSAWLTPVEIFKPWYGYALANYIQQTHSKLPPGTPLKIFEIGAGLGTCADCILTYLQTNFPALYKNTSYTIIEISPTLAQKQTQKLAPHAQTGSDRVQIRRASIFDWTERIDDECFVIGLEVFDNFPHDKIVRYGGDGGWYEAIVRQNTNGAHYEDYRPVSDALILNYLAFSPASLFQRFSDSFHSFISRFQSSSPSLRAPHQITYIPTMAFWFLQILFACFPRHKLILADFSHLPSRSEGMQAPVVQKKTGDRTVEFSHYLLPPKGTCDIFFPTNFRSLQQLYTALSTYIQTPRHHPSNDESTKHQSTTNDKFTKSEEPKREEAKREGGRIRETQILSNKSFMKLYANLEQTSTASGYNPLLEDYANMYFFISK